MNVRQPHLRVVRPSEAPGGPVDFDTLFRRYATLVSLLSAASAARADDVPPGPRVSVDLSGCDPSLAGEVKRIAGVELRAVVVDASDPRVPVTRAVVACHEAVADLWVSDPVTSKLVGRTVSLDPTAAPAQARLIALAVAELVMASWEEVESNPEPKVSAATRAAPELRASARAVVQAAKASATAVAAGGPTAGGPTDVGPPRIALDATGEARAFTGGAAVFGGAVRSSVRLVSAFTLRFDLGADFGDVSRLDGSVSPSGPMRSSTASWACRPAMPSWGCGATCKATRPSRSSAHGPR